MVSNKDNLYFPGQKKGWIRVLIKRDQSQGAVQTKVNLFDDEQDRFFTIKKRRDKSAKRSIQEDNVEQLCFNLFNAVIDSEQ